MRLDFDDYERDLLIDTIQMTIPKLLRDNGYQTAVIGKWHLGLGSGNVDWNTSISLGPNEVGFDYSFNKNFSIGASHERGTHSSIRFIFKNDHKNSVSDYQYKPANIKNNSSKYKKLIANITICNYVFLLSAVANILKQIVLQLKSKLSNSFDVRYILSEVYFLCYQYLDLKLAVIQYDVRLVEII